MFFFAIFEIKFEKEKFLKFVSRSKNFLFELKIFEKQLLKISHLPLETTSFFLSKNLLSINRQN